MVLQSTRWLYVNAKNILQQSTIDKGSMQSNSESSKLPMSAETLEIMLKAIRLNSLTTRQLRLVQQTAARRYRMALAFLVISNIVAVWLLLFSPNESITVASENETHSRHSNLGDTLSTKQAQSHPDTNVSTHSESSRLPLKSKITLVKPAADSSRSTYYGETLGLDAIALSEARSEVPHSSNRGASIGDPSPPRNERIDQIIKDRIPLSTRETLYLKSLIDNNERALYASPNVEQRSLRLDYKEGTIPSISVAKNNLATLSFVDRFGNPYKVSSISPERAGELFATDLVTGPETHGNVVEIRAFKLSGSSNISVMLGERTIPVVFQVNLSQSVNDAQTVVQFDALAPGYEASSLPQNTASQQLCRDDPVIELILAGVPPSNLHRLETGVPQIEAFQSESHQYIRSKNQVIDPECSCRVYGVDHLNVCRQPASIPLVLYVDKDSDQFSTLTLEKGV